MPYLRMGHLTKTYASLWSWPPGPTVPGVFLSVNKQLFRMQPLVRLLQAGPNYWLNIYGCFKLKLDSPSGNSDAQNTN